MLWFSGHFCEPGQPTCYRIAYSRRNVKRFFAFFEIFLYSSRALRPRGFKIQSTPSETICSRRNTSPTSPTSRMDRAVPPHRQSNRPAFCKNSKIIIPTIHSFADRKFERFRLFQPERTNSRVTSDGSRPGPPRRFYCTSRK